MNVKKDAKKWIAVYTKPRHEKLVEKELQKKGYEVYLPILRERRKWSDRKKWVDFPLFRSYLFVKVQIKNSLSTLFLGMQRTNALYLFVRLKILTRFGYQRLCCSKQKLKLFYHIMING